MYNSLGSRVRTEYFSIDRNSERMNNNDATQPLNRSPLGESACSNCAFSIAIVTVFSFAACQKQPSSADGTPAPQSPAAEASPAAVPTAPPATAVPVFSGYTNACQPVKVTFPTAGSASAFSVNFVLPEGWTVKAEADGASASLSDFCAGMDMRKLILDENGNCVGARMCRRI